MRRIKQWAGLALAVGGLLAGSVAVSVPAEAESVPSPAEACGNDYYEIDHHDLGSIATVHLLYNGTTDCVVTTKKVNRGTPTYALAAVARAQPDGTTDEWIQDYGKRAYYAGPVRVNASHTCIVWSGGADAPWHLWQSKPSHCK
ncbi:hypothetical protein [Amycolatopsis granulosa]|uniref:hypothetical protein n=1 Tax=Amycolatopsis granulosa TaxID=185684 RepID=UPI00141F7B46|nr:hypothetical protein [Amycolatopsis granulosa]NIH88064.1 hypothetical protein [Amycolatopsis granulosa]